MLLLFWRDEDAPAIETKAVAVQAEVRERAVVADARALDAAAPERERKVSR